MINNKLYMISGNNLTHLIHFLNSKIFNGLILASTNITGGKGIDFMEKIIVPDPIICDLSQCSEEHVDDLLSDYYQLTDVEKDFIDHL